tara:strand:+ start:19122 stop:20849 length:1728 start_codon:yes stop_codon:yes gene_type:complete
MINDNTAPGNPKDGDGEASDFSRTPSSSSSEEPVFSGQYPPDVEEGSQRNISRSIIIATHQNALACLLSQYGVGGGEAESGFLEHKGGLSTGNMDLISIIKGGAMKLGNGCIIKLHIDMQNKMVTIQLVFPGLVPKQNPEKPHKNAQLYPNVEPTLVVKGQDAFNDWKAKFAPDLQEGITDIYFIRHGEGEHNKATAGRAPHDAPLTSKGKLEAAAAGVWLETSGIENISLVCVSDLLRTTQTAWFVTRFIKSERFIGHNAGDLANYCKNKYVVLPTNYEMNDVAGNEGSRCKSFGIVGAHSMGLSFVSKTGENTPFYFFGDSDRCKTYDNPDKLSDLWTFGTSMYSLLGGMKGLSERIATISQVITNEPQRCVDSKDFKLMVLVVSLFDATGSIPIQSVCRYYDADAATVNDFRLQLNSESIVRQVSQVPYPAVDWSLYFAFWYQVWGWYTKQTGQKPISKASVSTGLSDKCLSSRRQFRLHHTALKVNPARFTNMIQSCTSYLSNGPPPSRLIPSNDTWRKVRPGSQGGKSRKSSTKRKMHKNKKTHKKRAKSNKTRRHKKRHVAKAKTRSRK